MSYPEEPELHLSLELSLADEDDNSSSRSSSVTDVQADVHYFIEHSTSDHVISTDEDSSSTMSLPSPSDHILSL